MTPSTPPASSGRPARVVVRPEHDGLRLDQAVAGEARLSRRRARQLISSGGVRRNGETVRVQSRTVEAGDVLELFLEAATEESSPAPDPPPVTVLFDDHWVLVADKPAGVLSQPASSSPLDDLALDQRLLLRLALVEGRRPFLRLLHRLDRLTSGVLLFARHPTSLGPLAAAWRDGRVERVYLAVVEGWLAAEGLELDAPIGRDHGHAWRFHVDAGGRRSRTHVAAVARISAGGEPATLVECRLGSGRTHQVRVHLAAAGHPVLGDRLYGSRRSAPRPLLHASSLSLPHPVTGETLRVVAPLPADLAAFAGWPSP